MSWQGVVTVIMLRGSLPCNCKWMQDYFQSASLNSLNYLCRVAAVFICANEIIELPCKRGHHSLPTELWDSWGTTPAHGHTAPVSRTETFNHMYYCFYRQEANTDWVTYFRHIIANTAICFEQKNISKALCASLKHTVLVFLSFLNESVFLKESVEIMIHWLTNELDSFIPKWVSVWTNRLGEWFNVKTKLFRNCESI